MGVMGCALILAGIGVPDRNVTRAPVLDDEIQNRSLKAIPGIVSSSPGLRPRSFRQPFAINTTQMLTMRHRRIDTPAQKERGRNPLLQNPNGEGVATRHSLTLLSLGSPCLHRSRRQRDGGQFQEVMVSGLAGFSTLGPVGARFSSVQYISNRWIIFAICSDSTGLTR